MRTYSLEDVRQAYKFYGRSPFIYRICSYLIFLGREDYLRKKAVESLNLKKGDRVLDLGCGMGYNFDYLEKCIGRDGKIIGIDYVKEMLNAARKRISKAGFKNIEVVEGDAAKISFPKNYFDGVISTIGISSIPNHKEALRLAMGSLKTNKRLVILDGKLFNPPLKILNPFIKYLRWSKSWDVNKEIINDLKKLFKNIYIEEFLCGLFFIITYIKKD